MNIWLVQHLCQKRHAIAALPYDRDVDDPPNAERALLAATEAAKIDPWCALCGSRELHFEHGKLPYTDWDEAVAALREVEQANLVSRAFFENIKQHGNN